MTERDDDDQTGNSRKSSSDWSDEDADEYLAKALAADLYLQGSSGTSETVPAEGGPLGDVSAPGDDSALKQGAEAAPAVKRGTIVIHHPLCELHSIPDHPERPGRVRAIMNALTRNFPEMCRLLAPEVELEQVLRFHSRAHVDKILLLCSKAEMLGKAADELAIARGGDGEAEVVGQGRKGIVLIDPDTSVMPTSRDAIMRAAGAACFAVDEVMSGRAHNAFCCVRPPGHHAEPDRAMGFCFFNNAPIGALHAQAKHGAERVALVDIDVHHGNGVQAFFNKDPTTFYASTHQGPRFYPGTGYDNITGVDNNILNVSMRGGEGSTGFREAYSEKVLPALEAFRPGLIMISAGFDAHKDDPLGGIMLDEEDYRWVTREICAVASRVCGGRVVSVLEGGYNLQAISNSAVAHVDALQEAAAAASSPPADKKEPSTSLGNPQEEDGACPPVEGSGVDHLHAAAVSIAAVGGEAPSAASGVNAETSGLNLTTTAPQNVLTAPTSSSPTSTDVGPSGPLDVDGGQPAPLALGEDAPAGICDVAEVGLGGVAGEEEEIDRLLAQLSVEDGAGEGEGSGGALAGATGDVPPIV